MQVARSRARGEIWHLRFSLSDGKELLGWCYHTWSADQKKNEFAWRIAL
jgi:hypothetical protein